MRRSARDNQPSAQVSILVVRGLPTTCLPGLGACVHGEDTGTRVIHSRPGVPPQAFKHGQETMFELMECSRETLFEQMVCSREIMFERTVWQ